jgi:3',5'-cyclic-AMP phosphodiesterase
VSGPTDPARYGSSAPVPDPFILLQLSDPHLGANWNGADPVRALAAAVETARSLHPPPDAVLVSGDLSEHATRDEYRQARELLAPLEAPLYVVAGNHDERGALRSAFELPGHDRDPIQYAADLGPMRLVVLDTTIPGVERGELDGDRLGWLDGELAREPTRPTVIAMHHPPIVTGIPAWDEIGLAPSDQRALGEVVQRNPQVLRIVAGHVHRAISGELGGRPVLAAPSTYLQAKLDLGLREIELADEPAGIAVHALIDGDLLSHIQPVRGGTPGD